MNSDPTARDAIPVHLLPDSERLLKTHNAWVASWDESDQEPEFNLDAIVREAFTMYAEGLLPIQVRWRIHELYPDLPARVAARIQRRAERALCAAESAPAPLRRAMVAAARQKAIQGALADRQWGAALRGLDRAGEIAGELREAAGLAEEDLRLSVVIEDPAALPAGSGEAIHPGLMTETAETVPAEID